MASPAGGWGVLAQKGSKLIVFQCLTSVGLRTTQTEGEPGVLSLLGPWIGGMLWPLSAPGSEKQTQEANMFLQMSGSKY